MNQYPDNFEDRLRATLQRRPAPEGFAERVLARTAPLPARARSWRIPVSIAAAVLISFGAIGAWKQHEEEQRRAEAAKRQLLLALEITSQKLAVVHHVLDRSTH